MRTRPHRRRSHTTTRPSRQRRNVTLSSCPLPLAVPPLRSPQKLPPPPHPPPSLPPPPLPHATVWLEASASLARLNNMKFLTMAEGKILSLPSPSSPLPLSLSPFSQITLVISSDSDYESSDEEEISRKAPPWARDPDLGLSLHTQSGTDPEQIFTPVRTCDLDGTPSPPLPSPHLLSFYPSLFFVLTLVQKFSKQRNESRMVEG